MKVIKKPIVLEAEEWVPGKNISCVKENPLIKGKYYINTIEGNMVINHNDIVMTGIEGEKYPCKREIFDKTYDVLEFDDYNYNHPLSPCFKCSNNKLNGGSGVCYCTLGIPKITY